MNQPGQSKKALAITSSAVTDRGLSPKRPLNEDSFLADSARGIFAVADGVGGAEAGEVASQTAIEVLDEAFRHQLEGADIEDLMELAIQRANASIHQMAQDHAKFSMMATTIVGLHLNGNVATIGHVGDSRLYRLTPAGQLLRETEDHSVVEEEVRAGRMTAAQAANHPSKNVISRALGAENVVEVDMKVIEVDDGTEFLLCTDGITRHIPDHELRQLLVTNDDLATVCSELKQRCYERGAEDNLTAVLVCVGSPISATDRDENLDETVTPETSPLVAAPSPQDIVQNAQPEMADNSAGVSVAAPVLSPPSRQAFPAGTSREREAIRARPIRVEVDERSPSKGGIERTMTRFFVLVLFLGAIAAAFYAGRRYKGPIPYLDQNEPPIAAASPFAPALDDPGLRLESGRREVDNDPTSWLANQMKAELTRQGVQNPLDSSDAAFLYLYGRASLLTGNNEEAVKAFQAAVTKSNLNPSPGNATVRNEAALGLAAAALKSDKDRPAALTHLDQVMQKPSQAAPLSSPLLSPLSSP